MLIVDPWSDKKVKRPQPRRIGGELFDNWYPERI